MIGSSTGMPSARILRSPLRASSDIELSLQTPPARFSRASLRRRELDVFGELVFRGGHAVARLAQIVGVGPVADRLDRDAEPAQALLVALEHLLERVLRGAGLALLAVARDRGEDRVLRQPLLGRHERDDEVDEPLLGRALHGRRWRAPPHPRVAGARAYFPCRPHRGAATGRSSGRARGCR